MKNKIRICIFLLFLAVNSAPAQSILPNGDMELMEGGNLLYWDYHTSGATVYTDPGFAQSGERCLKLDYSVGDNQEWCHQVFPIQPGTGYLCRGYYRVNEAVSSGAIHVVIRWFSSLVRDWDEFLGQDTIAADIGTTVTSEWVLFKATVESPANAIGADLTIWSGAQGPGGEAYFDNFTIYKLLRYPGFEYESSPPQTLPPGWHWGTTSGATASIERVASPVHSGNYAVKISFQSQSSPGDFAMLNSDFIELPSERTYRISVWIRATAAQSCFLGVAFQGGGDQRCYFPDGDYDWRRFSMLVTPGSDRISVFVVADDVTQALYIDDFEIEETDLKLSNLDAVWEPKPFPGIFPRSSNPPAEHLHVLDCRALNNDIRRMLAVLQGIVNRDQPRIYLINLSEDEFWLTWMKQKGYTAEEYRYSSWLDFLNAFKTYVTGVIIFDPQLMGSIHAACMLGSLENALPVSPTLSTQVGLPVIEDFRGRWPKNVEAYRWIYDNHWDRMNHHLLASVHPLTNYPSVWEYMAEFKVFAFWESNYNDSEEGNDPSAEQEFVYELYANTSPIIPVLGWYNYAYTKGVSEYEGVARASGFGKLTAGSEFCSNLSVHSGIDVSGVNFDQSAARALPLPPLENDKVYIAFSVIDSGDAQWYWQLYQLGVWNDSERGNLPINWSLNVTINETMPDVLQWYYENKTPNDYFFCAVSGLGYVITPHFATRFKPGDKETVWQEFLRLTSEYSQNLDVDMVAMHNGGWAEPTPPDDEMFPRYISAISGLRALLPDLGRHDNRIPASPSYMLNGVPVFHCTTRWDTTGSLPVDQEIQRLVNEIIAYTPPERPAFMNAMVLSWTYYPSVIKQVIEQLPSDYVVVSVYHLAELFRQHNATSVKDWWLFY